MSETNEQQTEPNEARMARIRRDGAEIRDLGFLAARVDELERLVPARGAVFEAIKAMYRNIAAFEAELAKDWRTKPGEPGTYNGGDMASVVEQARHATQTNVGQMYFDAGISQVPPPDHHDSVFVKSVVAIVKRHNEKMIDNGYERAVYDFDQMLWPRDAALPEDYERRAALKERLEISIQQRQHVAFNNGVRAACKHAHLKVIDALLKPVTP